MGGVVQPFTAEDCLRRVEAVEDALRRGFAPRGVPSTNGSSITEAARTVGCSRQSVMTGLNHPACPRQPDWSLYVPQPQTHVSRAEFDRRINAVEDALRAGYAPAGKSVAGSKGSAVQRAAVALGISDNALRKTLMHPACPRQPNWEIYVAPAKPDRNQGAPTPVVVSGWKRQREVPWASPPGQAAKYILTSAQNNTHIHEHFWLNLMTYASHIGARIMVSRFTYDKDSYGRGSVKPGKEPKKSDEGLWYDPAFREFENDERIRLAPDLVWCGEMNILPTAQRPLSRMHTYSGADSAIVPHAKIAMESVAQMKGTPAKMLYTTGTVTQRNYIQKKAGIVAEFHHCFAALLVEVDEDGDWFVRQINADDDGNFQDLGCVVEDQEVTEGNNIEAIVWGDIHADSLDPAITEACWGREGVLDSLQPRYQFLHDLLDFRSRNHHDVRDPHKRFRRFVERREEVLAEVLRSAQFVGRANRPWCETVVVDSNHDEALEKWLREGDYRTDPVNAIFFLEMQLAKYKALTHLEGRDFHTYEHAMRQCGVHERDARFLRPDESFVVAGVEHGMHGHLGPNGARGNAGNLSRIGHKSNVGHAHSAGIWDGLYVAGIMGDLDQGYNVGPSSWSRTFTATYPSGKRCQITMRGTKWRAS